MTKKHKLFFPIIFIFTIHFCWAENLILNGLTKESILDSETHFKSTFEELKVSSDIVLTEKYSNNFNINLIQYQAKGFGEIFTSLYIENNTNNSKSSLLIFTGGENRNELLNYKIEDITLFGNYLRVDIKVINTTGFQDPPDYIEHTTETTLSYIIGLNEDNNIEFLAGNIPIVKHYLEDNKITKPDSKISLSLLTNTSIKIEPVTDNISKNQLPYIGVHSLK